MASKLVLVTFVLVLIVVTTVKGLSVSPQADYLIPTHFTSRSCLDHYKKGSKSNGYYKIYISRKYLTVYCDMNSEPGAVWTLVESFAFKNKNMPQFSKHPLSTNAPVNENSPNHVLYRMTHANMAFIKSQSSHWRITCNFPTSQVDYTDYVRGKFTSFDVMTFQGSGICKLVEYINIRGHQCAYCTSQWWQLNNHYSLHVDSTQTGCQFNAIPGAAYVGGGGEDNFGLYYRSSKNFRCSSSPDSTTNIWFGGYI